MDSRILYNYKTVNIRWFWTVVQFGETQIAGSQYQPTKNNNNTKDGRLEDNMSYTKIMITLLRRFIPTLQR